MLLRRVPSSPETPGWVYEVKWDGYRMQAWKSGNSVRLLSRNGADYTRRFPSLAEAIARLKSKTLHLDGEVVAINETGRPSFGIDLAVRIDPPGPNGKAGEVGEFFWDGAANTLFWVDPRNKLTSVLLTQYKPFGKVPLHKEFRAAVYSGVDPEALPRRRP